MKSSECCNSKEEFNDVEHAFFQFQTSFLLVILSEAVIAWIRLLITDTTLVPLPQAMSSKLFGTTSIYLLTVLQIFFFAYYLIAVYRSAGILKKYGKLRMRPGLWAFSALIPAVGFVVPALIWRKSRVLMKS